ncbi:peptidylprolyl isomerase [bacterium]|nr:peptidylprolyl isomerase [bacterium]
MKKLVSCLALSTLLFTGCTFMHKSEGIIKVNDTVITQAEFDSEFDKSVDSSMFKAFGGAKNFVKSDENPMYNVFKEKIVNELIVKALLDQEIAKRGIEASEEDVQNELKDVIDKVGSKEELNHILKQRGVSNSEFMADLKTQVKMKKLINQIEKINVTDGDAKRFYDTNKSQFVHGEQVRASHILIGANTLEIIRKLKEKNPDIDPTKLNEEVEKQIASQKAKAEAILAEVKANPDNFEKIAKSKSDDKASGERGGELGFFPKEAMVPEFANAAFSMKPDTISEKLVQSPYGFHIIKVTDRMAAGTTPYEKVKDEIKAYLETQKQIEVLKNFTAGAMKTAKIEYLNSSFDPSKPIKINKEEEKTEDIK